MNRKIALMTLMCLALLGSGVAFAQTSESAISAYRSLVVVDHIDVPVPTVVELPFATQTLDRREILVIENGTNKVTPSFLKEIYTVKPALITTDTFSNSGNGASLLDNNLQTGVQYDLPDVGQGSTIINLRTDTPVTASGIVFNLERNVSLPVSIEITARNVGGIEQGERIILSRTKMLSERVNFIPTTAMFWTIKLTYAQPLKINELTLLQDSVESSVTRSVRFLAQPQMSYSIYFNPDRYAPVPYVESGNLTNDVGVRSVSASAVIRNVQYAPADIDSDGVQDSVDNCVNVINPDQTDMDRNGRGDACDDYDRDGRINSLDNCQNIPNVYQADVDNDGIGNECDGEESRFTERLPWVPWAGMGMAGLILLGLFIFVAKQPTKPQPVTGDDMTTPEA